MTSDLLKLLGEFLEIRERLHKCCAGSHVANRTFREMEAIEAKLAVAYAEWQQWCRKRDDGPCSECGRLEPTGWPDCVTCEMKRERR